MRERERERERERDGNREVMFVVSRRLFGVEAEGKHSSVKRALY